MALTEAQKKQKAKHIKYWRDREEEQLKHNITDEKEYEAELKRIYDNMLDACQKEIDAFYGRYAKQNNITLAEAKKAVSELDIKAYERKAKRYVKDKDFSKEANEEMRLYNLTMKVNRLEMLKANIGLELIAGHDELQKFMGKILQGRTEDELKRQAGILGKTIKNNAQTANAIVNASFHNAKFSDRIWMYQDLLKNDLDNLLQTGLIAGRNPRVLAKEVRHLFIGEPELKNGKKGADYSALRLLQTELARVQTEAQKQSFERNGFTMYTFIANGNCCPICEDINGKHFKVADMMPGKNAAPMHCFCRCSTAAYEDDKEYEEWLDYLANGGTTAEYEASKKAKAAVERDDNEKIDFASRRRERMAARKAQKNKPAFDSMDSKEMQKWAAENLKTKFGDLKGVNKDFLRETIKALYEFEGRNGGTIKGLSVKFGGLESSIAAKYDDKTKTLILKKTGSLKAFEEKQENANMRYRFKWKRDKDYYSTTTYKGTIFHELGHAVDIETGEELSRKLGNNKRLYEDAIQVSVYAGNRQNVRVTMASEAWAENFAAYMEGGANAKKVPPEVAEMIEQYFKRKRN